MIKLQDEPNTRELLSSQQSDSFRDNDATSDTSGNLESDDGLDQFKLIMSDDEQINKDGADDVTEEASIMDSSKKLELNDEDSSVDGVAVEDMDRSDVSTVKKLNSTEVENGDDNAVEKKVNGLDEVREEEIEVENKVNGVVDESESISENLSATEVLKEHSEGDDKSHSEKKQESDEKDKSPDKELKTNSSESEIEKVDCGKLSMDVTESLPLNDVATKTVTDDVQNTSSETPKATPADESCENSANAVSTSNADPASISGRSASSDSESKVALEPAEESKSAELLDEESQQSAQSLASSTDVETTVVRSRKRPFDQVDVTGSGAVKIHISKKHCSDGEDDQNCGDLEPHATKKRRTSLSEADFLKEIDNFQHNAGSQSTNLLKNDKWKPAELTEEEKKCLEQASAIEKRMRKNVLKVLRRNYQNMSTEDFEDSIFVVMMDYFCHYNSSTVLQRQTQILKKSLFKLQENYNRNFKQFVETKYLLRRMVELRNEAVKKCCCKDKMPFKLIRSVAVQVQTSRCRGGDSCPGTGVGLDPNFVPPTDSGSKASIVTPKKNSCDINQPASISRDEVSMSAVSSRTKETTSSAAAVNVSPAQSQPPTAAPDQPSGRRPISVSVPPPPVPTARVRTRPPYELQQASKLLTSPSRQPNPSDQKLSKLVLPSVPTTVTVTPPSQKNALKQNTSIVIDLTDKDEEQLVHPGSSSRALQKTPAPPATAPTQTAPTRVVKTSVLSPMPQLPPLPPAPLYKSTVKRPPQPLLKVCKADQSGIMLSWTLRTNVPLANEISLYQVYACQENAGVTREWSTVGDVNALPLPMACTLSQFREGHRYHFVVRAVDKFKVLGEFSHPASILLVSKNVSNNAIAAVANNTRR